MPQNVVNPGTVNVADQGDGLLVVDQPVTTGTSTNSGELSQGISAAPGTGSASPNQPVTVGTPQVANDTVQGGTYSPTSPNVDDTTENTVVHQVYGTGSPTNVFV